MNRAKYRGNRNLILLVKLVPFSTAVVLGVFCIVASVSDPEPRSGPSFGGSVKWALQIAQPAAFNATSYSQAPNMAVWGINFAGGRNPLVRWDGHYIGTQSD